MRLYTIQELGIVDKLGSGHSHIQPWANSAAVTGTPRDPDGAFHRSAYGFLANELPQRTGVAMFGAPIFAFLDRAMTMKTLKIGKPSGLLTLDVPDGELILVDYEFWRWTMLHGWCGLHDYDMTACSDSGCKERSWDRLFDVPPDTSHQQAVLGRIEPSWVVPFSELAANG